jgi:hypothetical protein
VRFEVECLPTGPAPQMITLGVTSMVIVMVLRKEVLRWIIYAPHLGQICGAPHFFVGSLIADLRKVPKKQPNKGGNDGKGEIFYAMSPIQTANRNWEKWFHSSLIYPRKVVQI